MKTNSTKRIVVSVLALAMGAGLAGSISGSVAWYQYSTRTTAQLEGVSAGTSRNLKVRIKGSESGWQNDLSTAMINQFLGIDDQDANKPNALSLNPVTIQTVGNAKNAALATRDEGATLDFKGHPTYQYGNLPNVGKTKGTGANLTYNYVQIPLEFKLEDNGVLVGGKDIYLVDALFNDLREGQAVTDHADITPALRVHFAGANNALLAPAATTTLSGNLDLNKDGEPDKDPETPTKFIGPDSENPNGAINYGNYGQVGAITQNSFTVAEGADQLIPNDADEYHFVGGTSLGQTVGVQNEQSYLTVTMTIWLEGWTALNVPDSNPASTSSLWDAKYNGSDFGLQFRFACQAEQ